MLFTMSLGFDPLPPFATLPHKRSIETRAKTMSNAHWIEMGDGSTRFPGGSGAPARDCRQMR